MTIQTTETRAIALARPRERSALNPISTLFIAVALALMAVIALGGVSYDKWLGFVWKPILILFGIGIVAILVGAYTGF